MHRLSRAHALKIAAVLSFVVGLAFFVFVLPELARGADAVAQSADGPPFFILVVALVFAVLRIVGSVGTWQGERWGIILTIFANALDLIAAAPGILFAPQPGWQLSAVSGVVISALVVVLCLWPGARSAQRT